MKYETKQEEEKLLNKIKSLSPSLENTAINDIAKFVIKNIDVLLNIPSNTKLYSYIGDTLLAGIATVSGSEAPKFQELCKAVEVQAKLDKMDENQIKAVIQAMKNLWNLLNNTHQVFPKINQLEENLHLALVEYLGSIRVRLENERTKKLGKMIYDAAKQDVRKDPTNDNLDQSSSFRIVNDILKGKI